MIREYQNSDFDDCVKLVDKVWGFNKHFDSPGLSQLHQKEYTGGSISESNFLRVVEENGQIAGFFFGRIENKKIPRSQYSNILEQLKFLLNLFGIPKLKFRKKLAYFFNSIYHTIIYDLNTRKHEINRRVVESKKSSEVVLFVVDPECQGKSYGKRLINDFIEACKNEKVKRIVLETDMECNYGFYEHLGFKVNSSFHSPLLQEYSGEAGETFIYELYLGNS